MDSLTVFRALGDPTRYAIYRALAGSSRPRSTADLAAELDLHPNTVRPHLERLRDAGLLQVERDSQGTVGRPQHRYEVAPGAPTLEPDAAARRALTDLLAEMVREGQVPPETVKEVGRRFGRRRAGAAARGGRSCVEVLNAELADLGFDPLSEQGGGSVTVSFTRCPFRELAEAHPEVVCELHRGLVEGVVGTTGGGSIERFSTLSDRHPCRVELAVG